MEQKFEGSPRADVRLEGRRVVRGEVVNDWGSLLQWVVRKNGQVVATVPARAEASYQHADATPGTYEVVLQMWKYVNYAKDPKGEFTVSKFIDVSDKVTYKI
ncbi:MAG TPA: hypothetical protein VKA46_02985 [Gemmataceae bacterium]|nr:hypothetical protein [Gemmataceae bacterium]